MPANTIHRSMFSFPNLRFVHTRFRIALAKISQFMITHNSIQAWHYRPLPDRGHPGEYSERPCLRLFVPDALTYARSLFLPLTALTPGICSLIYKEFGEKIAGIWAITDRNLCFKGMIPKRNSEIVFYEYACLCHNPTDKYDPRLCSGIRMQCLGTSAKTIGFIPVPDYFVHIHTSLASRF